MNFLLVNYEYPPLGGGAGNATLFIARSLLELGHRAVVLTSRFGDQPAYSTEESVIVHRVKAQRRAPDRSNQREMASFTMAALAAARTIAKAHHIDAVITFFTIPSAPVGWWLWRTMRIPYVISLRGGDVPGHVPGLQRTHSLLTPVRRSLLRNAKAVVANSGSLAELSQRADPVPVSVIPNGVDASYFRPVVNDQPSRSPAFHVLYAGRLHSDKGLDLLYRAVAALPSRDRKVVWLDIVGDGPMRPALEKLAQALGIDDRITWHGWRSKPEVADLYRGADCLANPSAYEGMPNTVLEAMASGLPVIASNVGGNNEVVRRGETGLLFELPDVDALRDHIATLLRDPHLCRTMGARARAIVLAEHSWQAVARGYGALFEPPRARPATAAMTESDSPSGADPESLAIDIEAQRDGGRQTPMGQARPLARQRITYAGDP